MEVLADRVEARRKMHDFYVNIFKNIDGVEVFSEPTNDFYSNHWLSAIVVDETKTGKSREDLRMAFLEEDIESSPLWKPMHLQPVFSEAPYYGTNIAEKLFDYGLCLPSGSNLSDDDRSRIRIVIEDVFAK